MGQRASDTRCITFEDVRVPASNILRSEGLGLEIAIRTFNYTRVFAAAAAVGLAQRCLDEALKYSLERKTFGVPIASHQAVSFMLADMAIGLETARLTYHQAARELDQNGPRISYLSSIAKCYASDVANRNATEALQIHGGCGYICQYPIEKLMRDAKVYQIYEGTTQIQKLSICRNLVNQAGSEA